MKSRQKRSEHDLDHGAKSIKPVDYGMSQLTSAIPSALAFLDSLKSLLDAQATMGELGRPYNPTSPLPQRRGTLMSKHQQLIDAIANMEEDQALAVAQQMLDGGEDPQAILDACKDAMAVVGQRYEQGEYFLPELVIAGDMLTAIGEKIKPLLHAQTEGAAKQGTVVIGTVQGDIHDIGKDIVGFMLDVNGFEVIDLGVDVPASEFVAKIQEVKPQVVGLSGFLTLAFDQMKATVDAIGAAGLREQVKIMIGGAIMDDTVCNYIGADAYGADATAAVRLAQGWTGGK
jgi:methanogenic corrinoid protein MtbC1